jgi:uncharacterized protein
VSEVSEILQAQYAQRDDRVAELLAAHPSLTLFEAAAVGHLGQVRHLLAADPGAVHAVAADGFQALHLASYFGRLEVVEALLSAGADPNAVASNQSAVQPLHSAAAARHTDVAERLLHAGADPNARQLGGWTPLHAAVLNQDRTLEDVLLAHGADPAVATDDGRMPADMRS